MRATILIVEDQEPIRRFIRLALSYEGYITLEADTGHEAVALIHDHPDPIDLMILDIVMPGLGGLDVANEFAVHRPETRVLYISGRVDSIAMQSIVEKQPQSVLAKPFTARDVVERVRRMLGDGGGDSKNAAGG